MNRAFGAVVVLAGLLGGCGADAVGACENASEAAQACADAFCETLGDACVPTEPDETVTCESQYGELSGDEAKAQIEIFDCQEKASADADCTTAEGVTAWGTALNACGTVEVAAE